MEVAKRHQDELKNLKEMVSNAYEYFKDNCDRYNSSKDFVFNTSLSENDIAVLKELGKPQLQANMLESMISRQRGEFSKQLPSVVVSKKDNKRKVDPALIESLEGHLRYMIYEANSDGCANDVYNDTLSGGFSAVKIFTEFQHEYSFDQVIRFKRVYDPTLCGWDPLAILPHKGDGRYCFELYPMSVDDFKESYSGVLDSDTSFSRNIEGFSWSFNDGKEKIVIVADFFLKKKVKKKIVKISTGDVMSMDDYNALLIKLEESGDIAEPPAIIGNPRWTEISKICRYRFIENKVIDYIETDFDELPIVYVDGNSQRLKNGRNGSSYQMTRPYVYHAKDIQRLKNFSIQTLANEMENIAQSKLKVAKESLPDEREYLEAYTDIQKASVIVYNAYSELNPDKPLPPPQEVHRTPIPNEVMTSIQMTDSMLQTTLGSFDASLGINQKQLSGVSIVEGATQANSAAMPYVVNYMNSMTQVLKVCLSLIPKYYVTPRTLPVVLPNGEREYVEVNSKGGTQLKYNSYELGVKVEAGVNFSIQKNRALNQIISMSSASPLFAEFINTKGLSVLVDNMEIRGIDQLKNMAKEFDEDISKRKQMEEQAQQQQQQIMLNNNPQMLNAQTKRAEVMSDIQNTIFEQKVKAAELEIDKQMADLEMLKTSSQISDKDMKASLERERLSAENARTASDFAIKQMEIQNENERKTAEFINRFSRIVKDNDQGSELGNTE